MLFRSDVHRHIARRGLVAEHGSSWLLPRLVGMHNACDLLFTGRLVDAQEALSMGLVNRIVPHDDTITRESGATCQLACSSWISLKPSWLR